jgi:hypothetical protein
MKAVGVGSMGYACMFLRAVAVLVTTDIVVMYFVLVLRISVGIGDIGYTEVAHAPSRVN